jgi:hypothetical protein
MCYVLHAGDSTGRKPGSQRMGHSGGHATRISSEAGTVRQQFPDEHPTVATIEGWILDPEWVQLWTIRTLQGLVLVCGPTFETHLVQTSGSCDRGQNCEARIDVHNDAYQGW